jgi:hypothetical protein
MMSAFAFTSIRNALVTQVEAMSGVSFSNEVIIPHGFRIRQ